MIRPFMLMCGSLIEGIYQCFVNFKLFLWVLFRYCLRRHRLCNARERSLRMGSARLSGSSIRTQPPRMLQLEGFVGARIPFGVAPGS